VAIPVPTIRAVQATAEIAGEAVIVEEAAAIRPRNR
jgi:hypothetical protein